MGLFEGIQSGQETQNSSSRNSISRLPRTTSSRWERYSSAAIAQAGIAVRVVNKVKDGRPHIADMVKAGEIQLVYTTVDETRTAIADSRYIRTASLAHRVTYYTTMAGSEAATEALKHQDDLAVISLQALHAELRAQSQA